jgi:hypothetical protein
MTFVDIVGIRCREEQLSQLTISIALALDSTAFDVWSNRFSLDHMPTMVNGLRGGCCSSNDSASHPNFGLAVQEAGKWPLQR